jgi:hypothetical protein
LYHIASKLNVNGRALLLSLFMEHQGLDYILLIATIIHCDGWHRRSCGGWAG